MTQRSNARAGITPVVAIALLLGMTVAASGGAYTFISSAQQQAQEDASSALATSVEMRAATCGRSVIDLALKNTGDTTISTSEADLYIYQVDELHTSRSDVDLSSYTLGPTDLIRPKLFVPDVLETGTRYTVELRLPQDDVTVEGTCEGFEDVGAAGIWTFDDKVPNTVTDTSGNGNDGTVHGEEHNGTLNGFDFDADSGWTAGVDGQALRFDGTDDHITVGDTTGFDRGAVSIFAWIRYDTTNQIHAIAHLMDGCISDGYFLTVDRTGGGFDKQLWLVSGSNGSNAGDFTSQATLEPGTWYHVGLIWNATGPSSSTQKLVIDGEVDASRSVGIGVPDAITSDLEIGRVTECWGTQRFDGSLDDVRVYDRALTDAEASALHGGTDIRDGLMGEWTFDEGSGTVAHDTSNWVEGTTGLGLSFDATDDEAAVPHAPSLLMDRYSITAWYRQNELSNEYDRVWDKGYAAASSAMLYGDSGEPLFYGVNAGSTVTNIRGSGSLGSWTHTASVYNGTHLLLYVNGTQAVDQKVSGDYNLTTTDDLYIGSKGGARYFNGTIDEVQVYPFAVD